MPTTHVLVIVTSHGVINATYPLAALPAADFDAVFQRFRSHEEQR